MEKEKKPRGKNGGRKKLDFLDKKSRVQLMITNRQIIKVGHSKLKEVMELAGEEA